MIAINLDRIRFTYVDQPVFRDLSWEIAEEGVAGLVGPNGAGKSTLLRLIAGELPTEGGFIARREGLTVGYLPQEVRLTPGATVWEEALTASHALAEVHATLAEVEARLAQPEVYGDELRLARALKRQERLVAEFERLGGPSYEGRVRATLLSLGFASTDLALSVDVLSGGQRKLVGLAKLLVDSPDLLLLDEPDNHLDLEGKAFLERFIRSYKGGVVIVSHDRYLLDLVVDEIVELEDGRLTRYPGNYSEYAYERQARLLRQQQRYNIQQREINRLEESVKRLMTWGHLYDNPKLIRRGQAIQKRIDRIDRIDRPVIERRRMGLDLGGWRGSNKVLELRQVTKVFPAPAGGENEIIAGADLLLWHGERVGLVGPNGAGKSVLLRLILGQEPPTRGEIVLGPSVRVGYYAQQHETLDPNLTLIETLTRDANLPEMPAIRHLLHFLFSYEQCRARVNTLSGGERSRLQLALLMLSGANLLLLDEPTNNLDIASAEVLEEALDEFEGTALIISHDRYLLDRATDRIVALKDGRLREYAGGYLAYAETLAQH